MSSVSCTRPYMQNKARCWERCLRSANFIICNLGASMFHFFFNSEILTSPYWKKERKKNKKERERESHPSALHIGKGGGGGITQSTICIFPFYLFPFEKKKFSAFQCKRWHSRMVRVVRMLLKSLICLAPSGFPVQQDNPGERSFTVPIV